MFCPNCGKKLIEDARFCDNCGREIAQQEIDAVNAMGAQEQKETNSVQEPAPKDEFFVPPPKSQPADRVCPYCKSLVKNTDIYCPVCKSFMAPTQYAPTQAPKKKNVLALVGFILSLISLFIPETLLWLALPVGVASLVLGIVGVVQVNAGKGKGKGFAITAIVIGALTVIGCLGYLADPTLYDSFYGEGGFEDMVKMFLQ